VPFPGAYRETTEDDTMNSFPRLLAFFLTATLLLPLGLAAQEASPVGRWETIDDETGERKSIVAIWEENGRLFGRIESLFRQPDEDPNPVCDQCDGDRKDQPIIGMNILWDLREDGDEYSGGQILDPNNGKTYRCKIALEDGGAKLKVRGFIGFSLLGRTQYWHRVE
jgi:uncharacterized protein (DUF2147 family)